MEKKNISAEEYLALSDNLLYFLELQIESYNGDIAIPHMPFLISICNTIQSLRELFIRIRPREVLKYQHQLYENEGKASNLIKKIISQITSVEDQEQYMRILEEYFIDFRSINKQNL